MPDDWELNDDLPREEVLFINVVPPCEMFFDDATRHDGAEAGVVLVSPDEHIFPYSFVLVNLCSKNVVEY